MQTWKGGEDANHTYFNSKAMLCYEFNAEANHDLCPKCIYAYVPSVILIKRPPYEEPLDWPTRKRVALGSAMGLSYLHDHCDPKIIHRDVKAANILLDEEFEAVVGDFGLAKLMDYKDTVWGLF
ncbi:hypothetical protein GLYMA_11G180700v4 [Glycine max]|uniref:non-specific serine/threonine protein kinase n=1 Tax=Glycine max TaxID=3847 RepID=A0A0R0HIQ2_SOYBN|nr:somatic embryogenesis receptor kinase 1 isoform X3 [Glycine max]XP_028188495.1 somatic embryogenesis receptor kinase 1-like isoform X2 [Glycine soja]KAH1159176.1 hypothetical protein GYH30_031076 [Glycine max]KRH30380.1 hypothetical protein GLYMA_11G180700v4 [Glycine max]|eukprot:XP_025980236.1 somatic embryogenesis receptor kinase 1 isoform X3 [Glycine max]